MKFSKSRPVVDVDDESLDEENLEEVVNFSNRKLLSQILRNCRNVKASKMFRILDILDSLE